MRVAFFLLVKDLVGSPDANYVYIIGMWPAHVMIRCTSKFLTCVYIFFLFFLSLISTRTWVLISCMLIHNYYWFTTICDIALLCTVIRKMYLDHDLIIWHEIGIYEMVYVRITETNVWLFHFILISRKCSCNNMIAYDSILPFLMKKCSKLVHNFICVIF